jgi:NAD(P)-dependent dehydrogenase (short-subunit alcohol dehydrogenase family)
MKHSWSINDIPNLKNRIVIVTGGNSGLGFESVKALASKGAEVILASRSVEKGEKAKDEIGAVNGSIRVMELDLQDFASINRFASEYLENYNKLDILINNAGIMTTPYFLTKDGLEGQMGTNHFGHFLLTSKLFEIIKASPGAKIINVSSSAHKNGKMDFNNLLFEGSNDYSPMKSYSRSKLANLLFTYELQRRIDSAGLDIQVLAAHPGVSMTNLGRHLEDKLWYKLLLPLAKGLTQDAAAGALPQLRSATDEKAKGGEFYGPDGFGEMKGAPIRVESNARSHNLEDAQKLWSESEKITGEIFSFIP